MNLRVPLLALACVVGCGALVGYKVAVLGYSFTPRPSEDRWSVQVSVLGTARGQRAKVMLALPAGSAGSRVYDERFSSPGLKLGIRSKNRLATFTSDPRETPGPVAVTYRFSTQVPREGVAAPVAPPKVEPADTQPSESVPSADADVVAKARELNPTASDDTARVRGLYDFVLDEVTADPVAFTGPIAEGALAVLERRRGDGPSRVRLFVALARSLAIPARVVHAVPLKEGVNRTLLVRAEVFLDGEWVAVDAVRGRFGPEAEEGFPVFRGDGELVRSEGLDDLRIDVTVAREGVNEYEHYQRRVRESGNLLDRLSFYNLPPLSQLVFRVLLLVPLGALIVSLFRNLVGVPTFGTFTPILIALALRETRPLVGLAVLAVVVGVGLAGRRSLEKMRLLIVPRLSLLLTFVIFIMGFIAVAATQAGLTDSLSIALLPMVIMTMTIERLSVLIAEEGARNALKTLGGTLLVSSAGYLAIQSDMLQRLVFTFPELNMIVVAALLLLGRYTGYRLSEWVRFRELATPEAKVEPKAAP